MRTSFLATLLAIGCVTEGAPDNHPANISSNVETETIIAIDDCVIPTEAVEHMVVETVRSGFLAGGQVMLTRVEANGLLQLKRVMDEQPERNPHLTPILACIDWDKVKPLDWNSTDIPTTATVPE